MADEQVLKILFSDHFGVTKETADKYGAFNISLVTDLPLFVDPFLLFTSKKPKYRQLHDEMIRYLRFLREKSVQQQVDKGLLRSWYHFKEVKQNWLGFSAKNNKGRGLGSEFATALDENLHHVFGDFGSETITKGSHMERLCLIKEGVGRDYISDFTVNLIKRFLLEYTQKFAKKYLRPEQCKEFSVEKVRFNYDTESWEYGRYHLPDFEGDFVLLTPKDMLTKGEGWINKPDLYAQFAEIQDAIPDEMLRSQINNYLRKALPQEPTKKEENEAKYKTLQEFPFIIDYFIKKKEDTGDLAESISAQKVEFSETLYIEQFTAIANFLIHKPGYLEQDTKGRLTLFKHAIEKEGWSHCLYAKGRPIPESDLGILCRFLFSNSTQSNRVHFKLGHNRSLSDILKKRQEMPAQNKMRDMLVIVCYTSEELNKVNIALATMELLEDGNIIIINARTISDERLVTGEAPPAAPPNLKCFITKGDEGTYLFEGRPIHVRDPKTQYFRIFETVFSISPTGGLVTYETIIETYRKNFKKEIGATQILRALTGESANLFKYIKDFKMAPALGVDLFEAVKDGKHIRFNNQKPH